MKNKKFYILLISMAALMLLAAFSFNGKALSAKIGSVQANQLLLLSREIRGQGNLAQSPSAYSSYTRVTDNEDKITMQVPIEWNDIDTGTWTYKGKDVGVFVAASGDLANFYSNRSQPGVFIGVSHSLAHTYSKDGFLGVEKNDFSRQCVYKARLDYENAFYVGKYDHYANCKGGTPNLLVFTTTTAGQQSLILIRIAIASNADLEAATRILNSFQVLGDPEHDDHHDQ